MRYLTSAHPLLFAAALVLDRFALTSSSTLELWRPLLVALILAASLMAIGRLIFRSMPSGALFASVVFLILALHPVPALVMSGVGAWWMLVLALRTRQSGRQPRVAPGDPPVTLAIGYSSVLFILAVWSSGTAVLPQLDDPPTLETGTRAAVATDRPSIYVLLLDGYPRGDTQAAAFGLDDAPFVNELNGLGFVVSENARANYNKTWLTVASLVNAQYVHTLPQISDPPSEAPPQARLMEELINSGAALDAFRAHGYEIVSIPSPIPTTDVTANAIVSQVPHLTSLEIALLTSALPSRLFPAQVLELLASDAREFVDAQLRRVADTASSQSGPRLVMAHLMAPHPPFVLGQTTDYLRECFPRCKVWETTVASTGLAPAEYARRMRLQIAALNDRVMATLTEIVTADPAATIIILSDHGARHYADNTEEHFRIFFAARPGDLGVAFPADISPVNVFRRILSTATGAPLADLPYEAWESDWYVPLTLSRYR